MPGRGPDEPRSFLEVEFDLEEGEDTDPELGGEPPATRGAPTAPAPRPYAPTAPAPRLYAPTALAPRPYAPIASPTTPTSPAASRYSPTPSPNGLTPPAPGRRGAEAPTAPPRGSSLSDLAAGAPHGARGSLADLATGDLPRAARGLSGFTPPGGTGHVAAPRTGSLADLAEAAAPRAGGSLDDLLGAQPNTATPGSQASGPQVPRATTQLFTTPTRGPLPSTPPPPAPLDPPQGPRRPRSAQRAPLVERQQSAYDSRRENEALPLTSAADERRELDRHPAAHAAADVPASEEQAVPLVSPAEQLLELDRQPARYPAADELAADGELELDRGSPFAPVPEPAAAAPPLAIERTGVLPVSAADLVADAAAQHSLPPTSDGLDLDIAPERLVRSEPAGTVFGGAPASTSGAPASTSGAPASSSVTAMMTPQPFPAFDTAPAVIGDLVVASREFFQSLDKAVKTLNLYEGRGESCVRAVAATYEVLRGIVARQALRLRITPYEFFVGDEVVYTSQEDRKGLSYRLFRDGVRQLELLPGIELLELQELLGIMRATLAASDEDDSVTLLWNKELPNVRYEAVDIFLEGLFEESAEMQTQIDELVALAEGPSVAVEIVDGQGLLATADAAAQAEGPARRQQRLAAVRRAADGASPLPSSEETTADLWRRAVRIVNRLLEIAPDDASIGELLARVLEDMWQNERWAVLVVACRAIAEVGSAAPGRPAARRLDEALARLCDPERLLSLQPLLASCTLAQFRVLAELFQILPRQANHGLVQLLTTMSAGEPQEQLAKLLATRDADLTEFHRRRLRSSNASHVIAAIAALKQRRAPAALAAIRGVLTHGNAKVRLEALRALAGTFEDKDAPDLLAGLAVDNRDLQLACCEALEPLPTGRRHVPQLVAVVKRDDFDDWHANSRRRMLQLVARWGGPEGNEFIVKRITAINPFRRGKVELQRQEMIEAVAHLGGPRMKQLFDACLQSKPAEPVRAAITAAQQQAQRERRP